MTLSNKRTFYFYKEGDATTFSHLHWRDLRRMFLEKLFLVKSDLDKVTWTRPYFPFTITPVEISYIRFDRQSYGGGFGGQPLSLNRILRPWDRLFPYYLHCSTPFVICEVSRGQGSCNGEKIIVTPTRQVHRSVILLTLVSLTNVILALWNCSLANVAWVELRQWKLTQDGKGQTSSTSWAEPSGLIVVADLLENSSFFLGSTKSWLQGT